MLSDVRSHGARMVALFGKSFQTWMFEFVLQHNKPPSPAEYKTAVDARRAQTDGIGLSLSTRLC